MAVVISTAQQFQDIMRNKKMVVVDFFAEWCGPCKMIAPEFEKLALEYKTDSQTAFVKVNVDNHRDIAKSYGITAMPTFIIFKGGAEAEKIVGADINKIKDAVKRHAPPQLFHGSGQTLSGGAAAHAPAPAAAATSDDAAQKLAPAVDASKPVTDLLVRLTDGKALKLKFNDTRTVTDLFATIAKVTKVDATKFRLLSTASFPPKPLEPSAQTLEAAGLINCAVTMKMK